MVSNENFPYGNDPDNPHLWAGLANAKSQKWLALYHSGIALGVGVHTVLFFGQENLVAFKAHLIGAGPQLTLGIKAPIKKVPRSGGASKEMQHWPERIADNTELSEQLHNTAKNNESLNNLNSAKSIYHAISYSPSNIISTIPFCANDLHLRGGVIRGVEVGALIGAAAQYKITALPYFIDMIVKNYSTEPTLVSASIGDLGVNWIVEETYSLWNELANSETEEYPFRGYNVHPLFHQYRNSMPAHLYNSKLYDIATKAGTNRNIRAQNMGLPATQMLDVMNKTDSLVSDFLSRMTKGENLVGHPLMKDIPYNMHHMFVGK